MRFLCSSLALLLSAVVCCGQAFTLHRPFLASVSASGPTNITDGLVLWYSFDTNTISGTTITDLSGSGNNGTINGSPGVTNSSITLGGLNLGQGMTFSTTNDWIDAGNSGTLNVTNTWTFCAWGYFGATWLQRGYEPMIIGKDQAGGRSYCFGWYGGGSFAGASVQINGTRYYDSNVRLPQALNNPDLAYEVATWNGTNLIFYAGKAGSMTNHSYTGASAPISATHVYIGKRSYAGSEQWWAGTAYDKSWLDDVRIYNRVLSSNEVYYLYKTWFAQ